jgi:uncharacterized protein (UPF0332 family)
MDANEFLSFAGRLTLAPKSGASDYRSAISRSYYAVYHLARQVLRDRLSFHCHDDNEHIWVYQHFYNCTGTAKEVGRLLNNLHEARKKADYNLDDGSVERQAQAQFELERATKIKSLLAQYETDAALLATIKAEMISWRTKAGKS